ncbi:MAG: hypothetical protein L3J70_03665 [Gammaproteobacteria bacterium]|nr:hypothetical protein [Gammaproteobacteria bacterium]
MLIFVSFILIVAFIGEYLLITLGVPTAIATIPLELLSGVTVLVVIAIAISKKTFALHFKYILVFGILLLFIVAGLIINQVQPGSIFYGIRAYFRFLPFFFIPIVYHFSGEQIKKILVLILLLILLQIPLVFYQRFVEFSHLVTGDVITGTFPDAGMLAICSIIPIVFLITSYLRNKISLKLLLILTPLFIIPAALNETKAALFFLPLLLIGPILFIENRKEKLKKILPVIISGTVFIILFVVIYNINYNRHYGGNILNMVFEEGHIEDYLSRGATTKSDGTKEGEVGRIDSFTLPFQVFSNQPIKYLFGVGIGNAISKHTSKLTAGNYSYKFRMHGGKMTIASQLIWEIGLIGLLIIILIFFLIFRDCLALRHGNHTENDIALSWITVMFIMLIMLFYSNSIATQQVGVLFWFLSGFVAAQRYRKDKKWQANQKH